MIVVEGQMDVIALDQAGIGEAVAPLGTALTEAQLEPALAALADAPILCFDGDAAGQKAAVRAALRALPHVGPGRSLGFVTLPAGQDPDDLDPRAAAARRSRRCSTRPSRWSTGSGATSATPSRSPRPSSAPGLQAPAARPCRGDRAIPTSATSIAPSCSTASTRSTRPPPRAGRGAAAARPAASRRRARASAERARRSARAGIDPQLGRAVLAGLVRFPDLIAGHAEAIDRPPAARSRRRAGCATSLLEAALTHAALDRDAPQYHIGRARRGGSWRGGCVRSADLPFPSPAGMPTPERARRDLVLAIETLAARPGSTPRWRRRRRG